MYTGKGPGTLPGKFVEESLRESELEGGGGERGSVWPAVFLLVLSGEPLSPLPASEGGRSKGCCDVPG